MSIPIPRAPRENVVRSGVLSVVIPAYNEESSLDLVVRSVLAHQLVGEVVIVDDGSIDRTAELAQEWERRDERVCLALHGRNQGKGAALRTGFQSVTKPYVIVQDADLEYSTDEYDLVIGPLIRGEADVVYGSRYKKKEPHRVTRFWHTTGNRALTLFSNMFSNLNLTDMETCYKGFRREVIQAIPLKENRFGFEPEITAKLSRMDLKVMETAVSYNPRGYSEGKKIGWKDGVWALWCIFKYNILYRRVYSWEHADGAEN